MLVYFHTGSAELALVQFSLKLLRLVLVLLGNVLRTPSKTSILLQIKSLSELSCLLKLYFCFTIASLLALLGLTSYSMYKQRMYKDLSDEEEFTVSLVQLIGLCEYCPSVDRMKTFTDGI